MPTRFHRRRGRGIATKPKAVKRPPEESSCWPTRRQELLLQAALLRGQKAVEAWNRWKSSADIDRLDPASHRLLPLLYRNLHAHGIEDPLMDKLKGGYRHTWSRNRLLFRGLAKLLRSLRESRIRTLALKGAPLALLYYRDPGLRPMSDVDVMVPTRDALKAVRFLQALGWKPLGSFREIDIPIRHGVGFKDSAGRRFDLHWHLLDECCRPGGDDDFWDGAVEIQIDGVPTLTLNAADHLLHLCAHGVRWEKIPAIRWIADALAIMNVSAPEIDWIRLAAQAEKHRLILPVREGLSYLREKFDAPVPREILQALRDLPVSNMERLEQRYKSEDQRNKMFGQLPVLWF